MFSNNIFCTCALVENQEWGNRISAQWGKVTVSPYTSLIRMFSTAVEFIRDPVEISIFLEIMPITGNAR